MFYQLCQSLCVYTCLRNQAIVWRYFLKTLNYHSVPHQLYSYMYGFFLGRLILTKYLTKIISFRVTKMSSKPVFILVEKLGNHTVMLYNLEVFFKGPKLSHCLGLSFCSINQINWCKLISLQYTQNLIIILSNYIKIFSCPQYPYYLKILYYSES